jgi:hypothetical protein
MIRFMRRLPLMPESVFIAVITGTVCACDIASAWLLFVK